MSFIIGRNPVYEALAGGTELEKIVIQYGTHGDIINKIKKLAKKYHVKVTELAVPKFNAIPNAKNSQGVIAYKSIHKYYDLDEIIGAAKRSPYPLILILDSIQDPHNLGAILRTAECSGVDGVIISTRGSASITETVEKTSAGAVSHLKICKAASINNIIPVLKEEGFWIMGSHLGNSRPYNKIDYKMPVAIILGNEEKGIHQLTAKNCDFLIEIPMKGKIQSLNVSVAAGVLLFEILRQRNSDI